MASRGNQRQLRNGLTQKENALKNKVLEQIGNHQPINQTEAAMQVYNTKNRKSAGKIASEVLAKPEIKEQIDAALEGEGLTPSKILGNIGKLANYEPTKVTADVILRSNQDLLRIMGGYPDKKSTHLKVNLKGTIGSVSFDQAKLMHDKVNAEVGQLVDDSE